MRWTRPAPTNGGGSARQAARLSWGVLGCAAIARNRLIPAIRGSRNGRVLAVASRDPARARAAAGEAQIPRAYGSYEALLADPEIAAVYLPLPNSLHREWTLRAAEAGKHVLCEKPLAVTAAEAEDMLDACRANGVLLMEGFMYRFHPRVQEAVRLARDGTIGALRLVRASFSSLQTAPGNIRMQPGLGGGAILDSACYGVNVCRMILGEPTHVAGVATWWPGGIPATVIGTLTFPGEAVGVIDASLAMAAQRSFEIVGTEGVIAVHYGPRPGWGTPSLRVRSPRHAPPSQRLPTGNHYRLMVESFADAVLGRTPLALPPEDSLANMQVLDTLRATVLPPAPQENMG
jgi:predicted dehydrogenase